MYSQNDDKYERLRDALPPIPSPTELYKKIVQACKRFHSLASSVSDFKRRVYKLCSAKDDCEKRWAELQIVETLRELKRSEFALIRLQLRQLFAVPPILIATGKMSAAQWNTIITTPQFDIKGDPLLMNHARIEMAIEDQLNILEEHHSILKQMREQLELEKQDESQNCLSKIPSMVEKIHEATTRTKEEGQGDDLRSLLDEFRTTLANDIQRWTKSRGLYPESTTTRTQSEGDCEMETPNEECIIRKNAVFMERLEGLSEDDEQDHTLQNAQRMANRRREIEEEIRQMEQSIANLEDIIYALDMEPWCEPRDFERGLINRPEDRTLPCVFCTRVGHHYSDSCTIVPTVAARKDIIERKGRCKVCLELEPEDHDCRRIRAPCYTIPYQNPALRAAPTARRIILKRVVAPCEKRKKMMIYYLLC
ncbi:unnamed protein product [Nippostrongylus brasiliensis]|uniref:CCHC-type domain-containing protein n=1 Tax=Nippostrongylus brasiliensis TaxID=27835 RepID=A0A0N4YWZ3_NIPBR|nr:unnamed protein product [Nippostrongylus brasiliensis]